MLRGCSAPAAPTAVIMARVHALDEERCTSLLSSAATRSLDTPNCALTSAEMDCYMDASFSSDSSGIAELLAPCIRRFRLPPPSAWALTEGEFEEAVRACIACIAEEVAQQARREKVKARARRRKDSAVARNGTAAAARRPMM